MSGGTRARVRGQSAGRQRAGRRSAALTLVASAAIVLLAACTAPTPAPAPTAATPTGLAPAITRPVAPEGDLPADLAAELQSTLDEAMAEYGVPGAAVGVWIPGEGSWTAVAGIADVETNAPVTADMQWPIRSITKSYTVTLILQLVDEGLISLDDTIDMYVDGVTDGDAVTLRQLADMSSGVSDYFTDAFIQDFFVDDPERLFTLDELNGYALGQPAQFAPGERKVYTNTNTNLLGKVIEVVTGRDFADALNTRILEPLGQTGTRYITDVSTWTAQHPLGYVTAESGTGWEDQIPDLSVFGPAGSMITTLDDARVWGDALGEGTLLTPATQTVRKEGAPLEVGPPYDLYALGMGQTNGWWGHNGEGLGYTAAVFHNPEAGATIAVFFNLSNVPDVHPADQLFRRFAALLDGRP